MNFSRETIEEIGKYYFKNSLRYFKDSYLPIVLLPGSPVPKHVAYLCPLCLEQVIMFVESPLQKVTTEFTEDHYPPKCVGGKEVVLVCRTCNSKAGHEYDFTLLEHMRHLSFQKKIPGSAIKTKTEIAGVGKFNGGFMIDDKGQMIVNMKKDERVAIKPLDEWIEYSKTNLNWTIQIHLRTPHDEKVEKALIHAAYLTCFKNFGYEFLFSPAGQLMRNVMAGLERYCCNVLDLNLNTETMLNTVPDGLVFISNPRELHSMAVNIRLINKETGYSTIKTVLIPAPTTDGFENTKRVGTTLLNYTGDISMTPLFNFLRMHVLPPYRTMWATLLRDFINK
jgi:hypothetical protein